jgi:phenylpyruvate tautomerase PptA (4-oxalocrotonate tautomerase family)
MVKLYALRESIEGRQTIISDAVQAALTEAIKLPAEKRAHRFFPLAREDLFMPPDRSDAYILIEITLMTGRSTEAKKKLVRAIFEHMEHDAAISPQDVEIVIYESPGENWGFRGLHGDEAQLNYKAKV